MMVCDVCFTPDPTATGSPTINVSGKGTPSQEYLFATYDDAGRRTPGSNYKIDLCRTCLTLLRQRAWGKIGERAHEALMLRLGVNPQGSDGESLPH